MKLFSRRGALSSAASFNGIGIAPVAAKSKEEGKGTEKPADEEMKDGEGADAKSEKGEGKDDKNDDNDDDEEGDDEGDEEEMRDKSADGKKTRAARMRERSRIASIMQHPNAAAHADFALKMALTSNLGRGSICQMLDAMPSMSAGNTLANRMEAHINRHVGPAPATQSGQEKIDASWDRAIAKVAKPLGG